MNKKNIRQAISSVKTNYFDLSSGVENKKHVKDENKITDILEELEDKMPIKKGIPLYDQADDNGFWGRFGETIYQNPSLKPANDLHSAFQELRHDKGFLKDLEKLRAEYIGRPTPFLSLKTLQKNLVEQKFGLNMASMSR